MDPLHPALDVLAGCRAPSQLVRDKEIDHVDEHCRRFVELSPVATLATTDPDGWPDVSPRGGDHCRLATPLPDDATMRAELEQEL